MGRLTVEAEILKERVVAMTQLKMLLTEREAVETTKARDDEKMSMLLLLHASMLIF